MSLDPVSPVLHRFTLRFREDSLEEAFQASYLEQSVIPVRWALLVGLFFYGPFFGLIDFLQRPPNLYGIISIRLGVCVVTAAVLAFTYTRRFKALMQPVLSGLILVAGFGLVAMMALDTSGIAYDDGPALLILPAYVLIRLRFVYATPVGWLIVVAYGLVAILETHHSTGTVAGRIVFLGAANLIGMFAGYALERYARTAFWQAWLIDKKRQENEQLLDVRTRFFANITHEFRTPLTLIQGPLDRLLEDNALDSDIRPRLQMMRRNAGRLLSLINQLLDLAKLDAGRMPLRVAPHDVVAFVQGILKSFEPLLEQKHLTLQLQGPDTLLAPIDPANLERVLVNLLSNAIKFTPNGGTIRVQVNTHKDKQQFTLAVRDSGVGIPQNKLTHVFERFEQDVHTSDETTLGTGIGLSLVKELIERHKGHVEVTSEVGFGSEFIVALPLNPSAYSPAEVASRSPATSVSTTSTRLSAPTDADELPPQSSPTPVTSQIDAPVVLVVEDTRDVHLLIQDTLSSNYVVEAAYDGDAGFAQATALIPDLIISDLRMPGMNGWELCRKLKTTPATDHIPVIMLTAQDSLERRVEGLEAGADAYLAKPFHPAELQAHVQNLIAQRQALRLRFSQEAHPHTINAEQLSEPSPSPIAVPSANAIFLRKAQDLVEAHIDDTHFNVDAFAEAMGMSRRQLQRKLRAVADQTPNGFIRLMRLKRGAQLLEQGFGYVADVAYAVGFNNPTYFATCFKETFGVSPSTFVATEKEHV